MGQIAVRKFIGSTSSFATVVGKQGDFGVDTTVNTIVVFDGATPGGTELTRTDYVWPDATSITPGYMSAAQYTTLAALAAIGNASPSATGYMTSADYNLLQSLASVSASIPNSSGNIPNTLVLRDALGDFEASIITASFVGNLTGNASTATNGVVTTGSYPNPVWITTLDGSKITGTIGAGVTILGAVPWTSVTGKPTVVSYFLNDAGYINNTGNTTGTSGGVLSSGGRETALATPNTLVFRNSSGTAAIATPVNPGDIATKAYVDANGGSYGYTPTTPINNGSNPLSFGTVSPFSLTLLTETATGVIQSIFIDITGIQGSGANTIVKFGFTVDGQPEVVLTVNDMIRGFAIANDVQTAATATFYKMVMNLPYKISITLRIFTTTSFSCASTAFATTIYRYLRSS